MCPSGLFPTLLVFGALSSRAISSPSYTLQSELMRALRTAREEMARIVVSTSIAQTLSATLPPAARYFISPIHDVRVYRNGISRWEGPFKVSRWVWNQAWITDDRGPSNSVQTPSCSRPPGRRQRGIRMRAFSACRATHRSNKWRLQQRTHGSPSSSTLRIRDAARPYPWPPRRPRWMVPRRGGSSNR